ncbi:MAG TPA: homoserine O-acetyltransferase [Candidatus Agrococcus pullicola]|uniref:Homoserine O-acetyltransferase n=1 Tax=Candidatus Agrococcus pullicola TaxID=2838429 RepID=A0A9D2C9K4_9MICO|nr:homoserine O-acetyltransferase [Candidatus Agrococcus pullicola]
MDFQRSDDTQLLQAVDPAFREDRGLIPTTGAWLPGDPVGTRQFVHLGAFSTESGAQVPAATIAYETWGTLNRDRSNAVLILHALTGDSHVIGDAGPGHATAGWWPGIVGPGLAIDTDRFFVVAPNVLGGCQGSTGPASLAPDGSAYGSRFPYLSIRDQVAAQLSFADAVGIDRFAAVIGGSMGGMHALEFAVTAPERTGSLAVLAAPAATAADQVAYGRLQIEAIERDPDWLGGDFYDLPDGHGPHRGLALARRIAMLSYRSELEVNDRFGRTLQSNIRPAHGGKFQVESYLDVHGNRFTRRFDAGSYRTLVHAMSSHDVTRERDDLPRVLDVLDMPALVLGIDTDRTFPLAGQRAITRALPLSVTGQEPYLLQSPYGHDAFLIELDEVSKALRLLPVFS